MYCICSITGEGVILADAFPDLCGDVQKTCRVREAVLEAEVSYMPPNINCSGATEGDSLCRRMENFLTNIGEAFVHEGQCGRGGCMKCGTSSGVGVWLVGW
jgi:hypothetical protein